MDIEKIKRLYNEGKTLTELGDMFKVDRNTIRYHLKKHGVPIRARKEVNQQRKIDISIESILYLINVEKMLVTEVAKYFGVSRATIGKRLKEAGLNLKNHKNQRERQSEFMKENNPVPKGCSRDEKLVEKLVEYKEKSLQHKIETFNPKSFKEYARFARYLAYKEYGLKTPNGMNIDHIYSLQDGYRDNVPVDIISHKENLRLIPEKENLEKGSSSLICLDELYKRVGVQRLATIA